jgi:hypothetical protein
MTVAEAIERLQLMPANAEVLVRSGEEDFVEPDIYWSDELELVKIEAE